MVRSITEYKPFVSVDEKKGFLYRSSLTGINRYKEEEKMVTPYNHKAIEKKWNERWAANPVNPKVDENGKEKPKYYCLDMFPYPSGNGLHVGHWRGYVISDVWSRYKLLQGYYIVHPMGWDAFGLPAENYAIKMWQISNVRLMKSQHFMTGIWK